MCYFLVLKIQAKPILLLVAFVPQKKECKHVSWRNKYYIYAHKHESGQGGKINKNILRDKSTLVKF